MLTSYQLDVGEMRLEDFIQKGKELYNKDKKNMYEHFENFYNEFGRVDVAALEEEWFPTVDADIFISHSAKDMEMIYGLLGWFSHYTKLKVFVDSAIWGNSRDLLKDIDDKHCKQDDGKYYSYEKRNISTSHVHMMLSTALTRMIDNSECVLFCRTKNSLPFDGANTSTDSPWIYAEITAANLLRRRRDRDIELLSESVMHKEARFEAKEPTFEYNLKLDEMKIINHKNMYDWKNNISKTNHGLDVLYNMMESSESLEAIVRTSILG